MEVKQTNKKFWKHKLLVKTGHDTRFWRVSKIMGEPVNNISTRCQKQFNDKNVWLFKKTNSQNTYRYRVHFHTDKVTLIIQNPLLKLLASKPSTKTIGLKIG